MGPAEQALERLDAYLFGTLVGFVLILPLFIGSEQCFMIFRIRAVTVACPFVFSVGADLVKSGLQREWLTPSARLVPLLR